MISGSDTIYFIYDANGVPMCLSHNGVKYFYATNLQGDVTAILTEGGTAVVKYTYDAWGKLLTVTGSKADTLGELNPLRYRGYVYDVETGLYYLSSRYYNPEIGRWFSPDTTDILTATPMGLTGKNLFAYCDNNPVVRADYDGQFWNIVVGAVVGVATQYISDVVTNIIDGKSFAEALKPTSTWADYGAAALSGALAATGIGLGASVAAGFTANSLNALRRGVTCSAV